MSSRSALSLVSSLFFVAACSSEPAGNNNATDSGPATTSDAKDTGAVVADEGPAVPCSEPGPAGATCVKTITGMVTDEKGAPLGKKLVSVCGRVCFFGETTADGKFVTEVNQNIRVADFAASVHGRPHHASLYEKIPTTTDENIVLPTTLILPGLNMTGTKIPITKVGTKRLVQTAVDITDGEVTLKFEANTEVELDLEDMAMIDEGLPGDHLRVAKVAEAQYPTFVKGANVKLLYAATPFDMKYIDKKVGVSLNNTAGLAEGAAVEFIALGNEFINEPFTAGKLQVVATGKVVSGKIVTDAGEGLKTLTWIGVRAK